MIANPGTNPGTIKIVVLLLLAACGTDAFAHGVMQNPPARNWFCGADTRPEEALYGSPEYPVCTEAFSDENEALNYEFMSVLSHSQGRSVESPLPKNVCGFDSEMFGNGRTPWDKALDWPTSKMSAGRNKITWNITWGRHWSDTEEFRYWITKPGFQFEVGKPLSWTDLESTPFCVLKYDDTNPVANPDVVARKATDQFDTYCSVPPRSGRQVIYGEWGRNYYTYERFHGCMDVTFGEGASQRAPQPAPEPAPAPAAEETPAAEMVQDEDAPANSESPDTDETLTADLPAPPATDEEAPADSDVVTADDEASPADDDVAMADDEEPATEVDQEPGLTPPAAPATIGDDDGPAAPGDMDEPANTPVEAEQVVPAETAERVVAFIVTDIAGPTFPGAGTVTLSAAQSTGENLEYRWSIASDNADLYSLSNASSETATLLLGRPETSGTLAVSLNVEGDNGSDSTVLTLNHVPLSTETPDRVDLGALTEVSRDLQSGDEVSIRLVLDDGTDVYHPEKPLSITDDTFGAAAWPNALGLAINEETDSIRIGVLDSNGTIDPAADATNNRIYARSSEAITSAFLIVGPRNEPSEAENAADQAETPPSAQATDDPQPEADAGPADALDTPQAAADAPEDEGANETPPEEVTPEADVANEAPSEAAPEADDANEAPVNMPVDAPADQEASDTVDTATANAADELASSQAASQAASQEAAAADDVDASADDEPEPAAPTGGSSGGTSTGSMDFGYLALLALAAALARRRTTSAL